jgi:alpha-N-acetylglucosaminidase
MNQWRMMKGVLLVVCVWATLWPVAHSRNLDAAAQVEAVRGLLRRVLPAHAHRFELHVHPSTLYDEWELESSTARVVVRGTSGVALASAFNWWLKYACNATYLWQEQQLAIPDPFPSLVKVGRLLSCCVSHSILSAHV